MHFRWSTKAYSIMRPVLGHRLAMWISDMLPVALFVGLPLLLFIWIASYPTKNDGASHGTCGSGRNTYDC